MDDFVDGWAYAVSMAALGRDHLVRHTELSVDQLHKPLDESLVAMLAAEHGISEGRARTALYYLKTPQRVAAWLVAEREEQDEKYRRLIGYAMCKEARGMPKPPVYERDVTVTLPDGRTVTVEQYRCEE